ncbi:MAG: tetratricopeptide repeat protein, partial [Candidatus Obscuribacterales bacterium]|nr:tetratricopeptide repeat protein [Candidatus Obscuribacterales bacterium]
MKGFSGKFSILNLVAFALPLMALAAPDAQAQQPGTSAPAASTAGGAYTPNPRAVSLYNLGLTAHKQGSPESAIIFFKRACDIDPNLADAQYNLGVLYQMQKRFKEAIPRFEEVLRIKPT